jgi:hypothetical protein
MRAAVGLPEGLENDRLLFGRDPDPGVPHREGDEALAWRRHAQGDLTAVRELDGVRHQVSQNLAEPLAVRLNLLGRARFDEAREPE